MKKLLDHYLFFARLIRAKALLLSAKFRKQGMIKTKLHNTYRLTLKIIFVALLIYTGLDLLTKLEQSSLVKNSLLPASAIVAIIELAIFLILPLAFAFCVFKKVFIRKKLDNFSKLSSLPYKTTEHINNSQLGSTRVQKNSFNPISFQIAKQTNELASKSSYLNLEGNTDKILRASILERAEFTNNQTVLNNALNKPINGNKEVENIINKASYFEKYLQQSLELTTLENSAVKPKLQFICPIKFIEDFTDKMEENILKKNLELDLIYPEFLPLLAVDSGMLELALKHILLNAIEYTPDNGRITIRIQVEQNNQGIYFEIEDTGIGIPRNLINDLGEPLLRGENACEINKNGVGLSLSIVKKVLEHHSAKLHCRSIIGCGSAFSFSILHSLAQK